MKKYLFLFFIIALSLNLSAQNTKENIHQILDNWHDAAAEANFEDYFSFMTDDAIFIGTDPTENWNRKQFEKFSKPYFDQGKAWSFTSVEGMENKTLCTFYFHSQRKRIRGDQVEKIF